MNTLALILGGLLAVELLVLVGRRTWVHWKLGRRQVLADEALTVLAAALVTGVAPEPPRGRVRRRAFRLAALELFPVVRGSSRSGLCRLVEEAGLVDDALRTLRRSPRAFARRTAASELGEMRSARSAQALADRLDDRDPIVRVVCVDALAALRDLGRIDRMLSVLDREAARAPSEAAGALVRLAREAPQHVEELQRSGESLYARRLAALALAEVGEQCAMPSLLGELATENALLSSVALRAIARVGGAEAIATLEHVVVDMGRDAALREQAQHALERVR
jgi:HEAT repeat protein